MPSPADRLALRGLALVALREYRLMLRSRGIRGAVAMLFAVAWLPPVLLALRAGEIGLAGFSETVPLVVAVTGVLLPLLGLLAGTDLLAGEMEDGTIVPVVTAPVGRTACYFGKFLGRGATLAVAYLTAFGSVAAAGLALHGPEGFVDYLVVAGSGLALSAACMGIGAALGAGGAGRVRAHAGALVVWVLLVFVVDAVLLTGIVALTPPAPADVGSHGHDELQAPMATGRQGLSGGERGGSTATTGSGTAAGAWLLALDPVDLHRLTAVVAAPGLAGRAAVPFGTSGASGPWPVALVGWLVWLAVPPIWGLARFRRARLG